MDLDPDCTSTKKLVRVTDPIDQRIWEVWFEPGDASWASHSEEPGISPARWIVQEPNGSQDPIDIDGVLTRPMLLDRLSTLLGDEETADAVLKLFDPLVVDGAGVIDPNVYVPLPCR